MTGVDTCALGGAPKAGAGSGGKMEALNELGVRRVAPSPSPDAFLLAREGREAVGFSALEIFGEDGRDCGCAWIGGGNGARCVCGAMGGGEKDGLCAAGD